ncbi:UNVERIFIED_ORG: hypothetical protein J2W19_001106 [Shinella zoogloeoides]|nr:hypothetical protein [Shinella zoogloeoides]
MKWSYSGGRSFKACQRQWFYKQIVGIGQAKAPERRKVYLLGKTDSISAWRGRLVDGLIGDEIVARHAQGRPFPTFRQMIALADARFDAQLEYARSHVASDISLRGDDENFALFREGETITDADIALARSEMKQALHTLYRAEAVKSVVKDADRLFNQRSLQFPILDNVTAVAIPDLIAFEWDSTPTIIDWKVHAQGTYDAWMQLAIYAIAIERCTPHRDWKDFFEGVERNAKTIRLLEVQLLTNVVREHRLTDEDFAAAEDFMMSTAYEMSCLVDERAYGEMEPEDFHQARSPEACDACSYKPLCWEVSE